MFVRSHLAALTLGISIAALGGSAFAQSPLPVVASFSILGDMTKEIGKEHVSVTTLVGPNGDAHVFEPTPSDARSLGSAKLLVTNGLHFEGWLPRLVESADFKGQTVVASTGVKPQDFMAGFAEEEEAEKTPGATDVHESAAAAHDHDEAGHDHGLEDPHAWQDLSNGAIYARNIVDALKSADPANASEYEASGKAYIEELKGLDTQIKQDLAAIPEASRKVVTSHDAFGYFGKAYKVDFIAPEGVSTEAEASAGDVARIVDQIKAEKIQAVFLENVSDPRLIQRIASETGAKIGGELYSDALSKSDGPASTYVDMFKNNVLELLKALKTS